jgi:flagellar motor switch protein FliG
MPFKRKPNLGRFKKTMQGMIEFASLIEQSDPKQREAILREVELEDSDFLATVMKKVVLFEEIVCLDEAVLAEILSKVSPKILAYALQGMPEVFRKDILRHLGHRGTKQFVDEEQLLNPELDQNFVLGARKQVLKIARQLEAQNKFVLEIPSDARAARQPDKKKTAAK